MEMEFSALQKACDSEITMISKRFFFCSCQDIIIRANKIGRGQRQSQPSSLRNSLVLISGSNVTGKSLVNQHQNRDTPPQTDLQIKLDVKASHDSDPLDMLLRKHQNEVFLSISVTYLVSQIICKLSR
jgi:hypothetical protein